MAANQKTDVMIEGAASEVRHELGLIGCNQQDKPELLKYIKAYWRAVEDMWNGGLSVSEEDFVTTLDYAYSKELKESIQNGCTFFITVGGERAGLIQINIDTLKSQLFIFDLYIFPKFQNQGYGKEVCDHCKHYAQEKKCKSMGLWVDKANLKAISFYKRQGFCYREDTTFDWHNQDGRIVHVSNVEYWECEISNNSID